MNSPTTPATYQVTIRAVKDSAALPDGLSWVSYRHWKWTGKEWLDEDGTIVTDLTGCLGWEKLEA